MAYFERLRRSASIGSAWYRYQANVSRKASGVASGISRWGRRSTMIGVASGSRAITENLQLDAVLDVKNSKQEFVNVDTIEGVTVAEIDWKPLLPAVAPKLDSLAANIPADQHAVFFADFGKLVQLIDEVNKNGTILDVFSDRIEQDRTLGNYEKQLCLKLDLAARAFGPSLAKSIAITGSDLELALGTDVAVLLESPSPALLLTAVSTQQKAAIAAAADCSADDGTIDGIKYFGARSKDRSVSSYACDLGGVVAVTNSVAQLKRLVATRKGTVKSMKSLDEYKFFRHRYPLTNADETVFVMLTDATIRRWCSAKWRIAASRRVSVAAILANETATMMDSLTNQTVTPETREPEWEVGGLERISVSNRGCSSKTYGDLNFMTPIIELTPETVSVTEKDAYKLWRDQFHSSWGKFFDPIGISLEVKPRKVAMDVSVMPLILGSEYRGLIDLTSGTQLLADSGDRHRGSMLHFVFAVNSKADLLRDLSRFNPPVKGNEWDWAGRSLSIVFEHDRFWKEMAEAYQAGDERLTNFTVKNFSRLPLYFRMDVADKVAAAEFEKRVLRLMAGIPAGFLKPTSVEYNGVKYTRYLPTAAGKQMINNANGNNPPDVEPNIGLSFGLAGQSFVITPNDAVMRAAIDRDQGRIKAIAEGQKPKSSGRPWLGKSLGMQADLRLIEDFIGSVASEYGRMQMQSWSNIPILNEWKDRYPDKDPQDVQSAVWGQIVRCPGGGKYQWNAEHKTYESTVYGHPAVPRQGPAYPEALRKIERVNFGITFEDDGLRSRVEFDRSKF